MPRQQYSLSHCVSFVKCLCVSQSVLILERRRWLNQIIRVNSQKWTCESLSRWRAGFPVICINTEGPAPLHFLVFSCGFYFREMFLWRFTQASTKPEKPGKTFTNRPQCKTLPSWLFCFSSHNFMLSPRETSEPCHGSRRNKVGVAVAKWLRQLPHNHNLLKPRDLCCMSHPRLSPCISCSSFPLTLSYWKKWL